MRETHASPFFASFCMTAGPGCVLGLYSAMGGYYIFHFKDSSFYIAMLACFFLPQPVAYLMQQYLDQRFDEYFSVPVTFRVRVVAMQFVLGITILIWMLLPDRPCFVIAVGSTLGFMYAAIVSSSLQLASAIDPQYCIPAKLGLGVGGAFAPLIFSIANVQPSSAPHEIKFAHLSVVLICIIATTTLVSFHDGSDFFPKAYEALQPLDEPLLGEKVRPGISRWVRVWQVGYGASMAFSFFINSRAGFFGNAQLAQELTLLRLVMDLVGRIVAISIPNFLEFDKGPHHYVFAFLATLLLILGGVCLTKEFTQDDVPQPLFLFSWCAFFIVNNLLNSLTDVTTTSHVALQDRRAVARTNQFVLTNGILLGLLVSSLANGFLLHPRHVVNRFMAGK